MKIIVSTTLLARFRVDWFEELAKFADVSVYYLYSEDVERDKKWFSDLQNSKVKFVLEKGRKWGKLGKISSDFRKEIKKNSYDVVILDGYGYFDQVLNIRFLSKKKINYFVNMDGIVNPEVGNGIKDRLKRRLISKIPYFLCGSLSAKQYLINCGIEENRVFNHVFTSLYRSDIFNDVASIDEKKALRKELNITEEHVVISVGRFTYLNGYGKGYDVLLRSAETLPKDIGWYIVGGEPTEEFAIITAEKNLTNVHYIDFKNKEELKLYYRASDLFVLMTVSDVWGLVINEAMACGLPVITTDKCVAGRELIKNGVNGYVIGVGDDAALSERIKEIIYSADTLNETGKNSLTVIKDCTIEKMAEIHKGVFENIQNAK